MFLYLLQMGQDISIGSTSVGRSAAIVSNMSVEILVPQTVIALVYEGEWKQPHSFKTGNWNWNSTSIYFSIIALKIGLLIAINK